MANSIAKIEACKRRVSDAISGLSRVLNEVPGGSELMNRLTQAIEALVTPEEASLDPVFKLTEEVQAKVKFALRAKAEKALIKRYSRASEQLLRFADRIPGAEAIVQKMEAVGELDLAGEKDLQPLFKLCDEVLLTVGNFQNDLIVTKINTAIDRWLTVKDKLTGEMVTGRFAEPFAESSACLQALHWKANKPAADADFRDFKAWRDQGYALLKGDLDHPWGVCQCGQEKLLPWQDKKTGQWRISRLGRECYNTQKEVPAEAKPKHHRVAKPNSARKRHKGAKKIAVNVLTEKDEMVNAKLAAKAKER